MRHEKKIRLELYPTPEHSSRHRIKSSSHWGQQRFPLAARHTASGPPLRIVSFSPGQTLSAAVWFEKPGRWLCSAKPTASCQAARRNTSHWQRAHKPQGKRAVPAPSHSFHSLYSLRKIQTSLHAGLLCTFLLLDITSCSWKNKPEKVKVKGYKRKMCFYN